MKCEVEYCVYNCKNSCLLESIEINSLGMCGECIIVALDEDLLEKMKAQQLMKLQK